MNMVKTRGPNFSSEEKEILVKLVAKYRNDVLNKKIDAVTTAAKNEGWRKLTEDYNSLDSVCVRTTEQLKFCWRNLKRDTRKDIARKRKEKRESEESSKLSSTLLLHGQVDALLRPNPGDSHDLEQHPEPSSYSYDVKLVEAIKFEPTCHIDDSETISESDECLDTIQKNKCTPDPLATSSEPTAGQMHVPMSRDEGLITVREDKAKMTWHESPAASKTNDSPSWVKRRRPMASMYDKLLEKKLELVQLMTKNAESEANIKNAILEEKLKQEQLKTKALELQLGLSQ